MLRWVRQSHKTDLLPLLLLQSHFSFVIKKLYLKKQPKNLQTAAVEQHSPELSEYFMTLWIFLTSHSVHNTIKGQVKVSSCTEHWCYVHMYVSLGAPVFSKLTWWQGSQAFKSCSWGMWMPAGVIVILWSGRISQMSHTPPGSGQGCQLWHTTASVDGSKRCCVSQCPINTASGQ